MYALTSIAATTNATIYGQLLARNGAVTTTTTSPEISNELPATGGTTRLLIVIGAILLMTGMVRISFGRRG